MKITIFYFSGTGNTMYGARYLGQQLKLSGNSVKTINIENLLDINSDLLIKQSDIIFLMYPIYGSDLPSNMKHFINALPLVDQKSLGVICTQLLVSGDGASVFYKVLKQKGYHQKWGYQLLMPNNLTIPSSPFKARNYEENESYRLKNARSKLKKIALDVVNDREHISDNTIFHHLLAFTQRPLYRAHGSKPENIKLDINQDKCTQCCLCSNICPNQVIEYSPADHMVSFTNMDNCANCLRCYNFCPVGAITWGGKSKENRYLGPTKKIYKSIIKMN